jgi:hypothetical protein
MAGLSFLYAFFNLYSTGGGPGVPTLEEAMMDIESCMAVLEYLSRRSTNFECGTAMLTTMQLGFPRPLRVTKPCGPSRRRSWSS